MTSSLGICLWFDNQGKQAADFYRSVFSDFTLISENPSVVNYTLCGLKMMHLNGGPQFIINQSISFIVEMNDAESLQNVWDKLCAGGTVLMSIKSYPWSKKYGWCSDQYGVNWQLMLTDRSETTVVPSMMFTQKNNGKVNEAIKYYTAMFSSSSIDSVSKYEKEDQDIEGNVKYSRFRLNDVVFSAMESSLPHQFTFNEAVSFMITVDTQEEIDFFWERLLADGQGEAGRCGWIKDKYGVSWQVVPSILSKLMSNPTTAPQAASAFMQMSKFNIHDLEIAATTKV